MQGVQKRCFAHPQDFQGVQLHTLHTPFRSPWVTRTISSPPQSDHYIENGIALCIALGSKSSIHDSGNILYARNNSATCLIQNSFLVAAHAEQVPCELYYLILRGVVKASSRCINIPTRFGVPGSNFLIPGGSRPNKVTPQKRSSCTTQHWRPQLQVFTHDGTRLIMLEPCTLNDLNCIFERMRRVAI